jgi:hypothetical protein
MFLSATPYDTHDESWCLTRLASWRNQQFLVSEDAMKT